MPAVRLACVRRWRSDVTKPPGYLVLMPDGTPMPDAYNAPILFTTREDADRIAALFPGCIAKPLVRYRKPRTPRHEYGTKS
jgi:hypothetical protein